MGKIITSGKDLIKDKKADKGVLKEEEDIVRPSPEEFAEANTPELSTDYFTIADKTFLYKISNIKTQKIMAKALDAVSNFIGKIDIKTAFDKLREIFKNQQEEDEIDSKVSEYIDMAEIVKVIVEQGGLSNIYIAILELYSKSVYAICNSQDASITMDWIEENTNFNQAQEIFFRQMAKDNIGGKVINFLYGLTRAIVGEKRKENQ